MGLTYALKGDRQGFNILPTDNIEHCADGYTEVRRNNTVVGVYLTMLLDGRPDDAPLRSIGERA